MRGTALSVIRVALVAEFVGTALLVGGVVGSGIMGDRLAAEDKAVALLANSLATGGVLVALLVSFGPVSGAHLNPLVSFERASRGHLSWRSAGMYAGAQCLGGLVGVVCAHLMFELAPIATYAGERTGLGQWLGEVVATFGLVLAIGLTSRHRPTATPLVVAAYIVGAYWFTSSTAFANPAVTMARALTDTFAGIRPQDVPGFLVAQALGAMLASRLDVWMERQERESMK